jgi:hypothetical protein
MPAERLPSKISEAAGIFLSLLPRWFSLLLFKERPLKITNHIDEE